MKKEGTSFLQNTEEVVGRKAIFFKGRPFFAFVSLMGKRNHGVENWIKSLIIIVKAKVIFEGKFNIRKSEKNCQNRGKGVMDAI